MNALEEIFRDKRILTVSSWGAQRYTLRKETEEERLLRQIRAADTAPPWTPFTMAYRGEVRRFAQGGYRCARDHLMMPGYEPDRNCVLWKPVP